MFFRNKYLVVYEWFENEEGYRKQGVGSVEVTFFGTMNFDKLRKIRKEIATNCEFQDVVVTNLIRL